MYRGMPPNGKLYSLIDSNVEEDLLKGEVNSLEFRNLSWVAPAVKNLKKFKNLTRESLNLSVTVDLWPWTFGGWRKVSETLILSLEDFSSENSVLTENMTFSFSTEDQIVTLSPLDYAKKTGAWKGRLDRFFVDLYQVELAKIGANII